MKSESIINIEEILKSIESSVAETKAKIDSGVEISDSAMRRYNRRIGDIADIKENIIPAIESANSEGKAFCISCESFATRPSVVKMEIGQYLRRESSYLS